MDILTFPGYITRHIPMLIRQKMIKPEFDKTEHARQNLKYHTLIRQSLIRQKLIRMRMLYRICINTLYSLLWDLMVQIVPI